VGREAPAVALPPSGRPTQRRSGRYSSNDGRRYPRSATRPSTRSSRVVAHARPQLRSGEQYAADALIRSPDNGSSTDRCRRCRWGDGYGCAARTSTRSSIAAASADRPTAVGRLPRRFGRASYSHFRWWRGHTLTKRDSVSQEHKKCSAHKRLSRESFERVRVLLAPADGLTGIEGRVRVRDRGQSGRSGRRKLRRACQV
jgi:hypothetical protein